MEILSILVPIIVAVIAALASVITVVLQTKKTRCEQKEQFDKQREALDMQSAILNQISTEDLAILKETQKDMIRNEIKKIYFRNQSSKTLNQYDRESLDSLYKGYEILKGNSFVKDIYAEMRTWEIVNPTQHLDCSE